jgi:TfoX/Sxy family transcriptional regulator of competence genes
MEVVEVSPASDPAMPGMPKPGDDTKEFFRSIVPEEPDVAVRPMFGNLAAFVNGNLFCGLFGDGLFVRVSEDERAALESAGGGPFEPMPGRQMTGYTMLPDAWQRDAERAGEWIDRSLAFGRALPPKQPKPKKPKKA